MVKRLAWVWILLCPLELEQVTFISLSLLKSLRSLPIAPEMASPSLKQLSRLCRIWLIYTSSSLSTLKPYWTCFRYLNVPCSFPPKWFCICYFWSWEWNLHTHSTLVHFTSLTAVHLSDLSSTVISPWKFFLTPPPHSHYWFGSFTWTPIAPCASIH